MVKTKDKVAERVAGAAGSARPYVERALRDEELRKSVKHALVAAREVYQDLIGGRGVSSVASRVATDKEVQENLRTAVEELRRAARRLQAGERRSSRNSTLLLAGVTLGILFNPATGPATRKWLKEKIFGHGGDTFTYGSGNSN